MNSHFPRPQGSPPGRSRSAPPRPWLNALLRGLMMRCPNCGIGSYRRGYLTVTERCDHCGEKLGHIRADDGPAYFTVLIVGHIVVPGALVVEQEWAPPLVPFVLVALLVTALLIWALLPPIKGAMVGLMWALKLRGDEIQGETPHEPRH